MNRFSKSAMTTMLAAPLLFLAVAAMPASAEEFPGCTNFSWSLEKELSQMTAKAEPVANGAEIAAPADAAVELSLVPADSVKLPFEAGIKSKAVPPASFSGWFRIDNIPKDGSYQVSISGHGWIDVVQNDEVLESTAFTGNRDCKIVRKSVRYQLKTGPVVIQLSGLPEKTVKVIVSPAN